MKSSLNLMSLRLAALVAFDARFQVGDRLATVQPLDDANRPCVTFYADPDRAWILQTFGADGWKTSYKSGGFQHVAKVVDGVQVTFHGAYTIDNTPAQPVAVPPALLRAGRGPEGLSA